MQQQAQVLKSNIFFLKQGIELLTGVSDQEYTSSKGKYNKSGIGRHFRHIIEHYFSLVATKDNTVDYDARERDLRLETDRNFMIQSMQRVINELLEFGLNDDRLDALVVVRSNEGIGEENAPLSTSTIRRELQFLISHTVHHYALIGLILKTMGVEPGSEFGVAPSTLKYEHEKSLKAPVS